MGEVGVLNQVVLVIDFVRLGKGWPLLFPFF